MRSTEEVKPRRQYRSSARTRQREATRAAIVDAATAAFIENGYATTTIAQIAARADVSPETVYAAFGTKRDLLRMVVEGASAGAPNTDAWRTGTWLARVESEPSQRRRLELIADATRGVLRRVAPIDEIVRSVAASDPEIAELQDEIERRRRSDLRGLVQLLMQAGPLRVSIDDAVDLWWSRLCTTEHSSRPKGAIGTANLRPQNFGRSYDGYHEPAARLAYVVYSETTFSAVRAWSIWS